jgi:hypothetical protein
MRTTSEPRTQRVPNSEPRPQRVFERSKRPLASILALTLAGLTLFGLAAESVHAQGANPNLRYAPNRNVNAAANQAVLSNQTAPHNTAFRYGAPYVNSPQGVPYGGPGGYGAYGYNPYVYRPTAAEGYLNGVANVTQAQGQYEQQIQGAKLDRQKAIQESINTRQQLFDERRYEQANTPTQQERLDWRRQQREYAARNNATLVTITSGDVLNTLLTHSGKVQSMGIYGPKIPVDQSILKDINIASLTTGGTAGMLKNGGKLDWPLPLQDDAYMQPRSQVDKLLQEAVEQAQKYNKVDRSVQADLEQARQKMENTVNDRVADLTPDQFILSKRYLRELKDNLKILADPNVARFFGSAGEVEGDTVADLVANMTAKGQKFGPAVRGAESSYMSLYNSMRAYDVALAGLAHEKPARQPFVP